MEFGYDQIKNQMDNLIGEGCFGQVFEVIEPNSGLKLAVKVFQILSN